MPNSMFGMQSIQLVIIYPANGCIRARGGMPQGMNEDAYYVNQDSKFNDIPILTAMRFLWNGIPQIDFMTKVVYPLNNGLGSMLVGNSNLLQCAQFTDEGGPLGNPNHAVALALEAAGDDTVIKNHRLRKIKLFHCLLNYIKVSSRTYRMLMRQSSNLGMSTSLIE